MSHRSYHSNIGAVLLELTLFVLIILLIGFSGFELTASLKHRKMAISLSRELANTVYRECSDAYQIDKTGCLGNIHTNMQNFAQTLAPLSYVAVSVYSYDVRSETDPTFPSNPKTCCRSRT